MATIMLIDDDAELRQFLHDKLKMQHHDVCCLDHAEMGAELLSMREWDLVLVDENMPGRTSGSEFLKVLRKKGLRIPAILMTGFAKGKLSEEMKKLDVVVVSKPASGRDEVWKELEEYVADALKGELEIEASLKHAVDVALRVGKTDLFQYLRALLDHALLIRISAEAKSLKDAKLILGVPLAQLTQEKPAKSSDLSIRAVTLIVNEPHLSVDEIAERLGCSRSTLYRIKSVKTALRLRKGGNFRGHTGYKDADGNVEADDD